ncbi:MAG: CoA transferase [Acidobacteria bacterium]|nr:CoA transferase [Acidobacteriota bacterium]MCH8970535.1 CoA transferase [Acidobacteriota bacterium]
MSDRPLEGVLVAEFGNLIAAPYAAMLLADLGARVIKVEPPGGDLGRRFGPFQKGESAFFMTVNRGKESIALDTKNWVSKRVLDNLIKKADVLVHNLRHGAMERLGLGEDRCRELNANLIYAVVSAFGATGPYAKRSGIDLIFQGESGMISITGNSKDGPRKTATTIGDYVAATNTALAISAALAETPRKGRRIDVSLRDGLMAVQAGWNAIGFVNHAQPERTGTASPFLAPNQVFGAADGPFTLAIVSDRHFAQLGDALGRPDLVEDFPTNEARIEGRESLARKLTRLFKTRNAEYWIDLLTDAGLPVGRVLSLAEAFDDPQARHHEMLVEFDHPVAGHVRTTGSPIRLDGGPARAPTLPPTLGQHTRGILDELGLDPNTVEKMIEEGTAVAS